jgi:hypothetical protein
VAEERVIKLLEEIRDLQKLHVENYAVKNQQESIEYPEASTEAPEDNQPSARCDPGVAFLVFLAWSSH